MRKLLPLNSHYIMRVGDNLTINSIKGTIYDLLGYFAPGLAACIGGLLIFQQANGTQDVFAAMRAVVKGLSVFEAFLVIVISYVLGHAIASASSWLIEKKLVEHVKGLKDAVHVENILDSTHYEVFCRKYATAFQAPYGSRDIRRVICYVQAKQPAVYETSMTFLAFYGMARNLSLISGALCIAEEVLIGRICENLLILALLAVLSLIFLYEYIRFRKYYLDTILSGFLIPTE